MFRTVHHNTDVYYDTLADSQGFKSGIRFDTKRISFESV